MSVFTSDRNIFWKQIPQPTGKVIPGLVMRTVPDTQPGAVNPTLSFYEYNGALVNWSGNDAYEAHKFLAQYATKEGEVPFQTPLDVVRRCTIKGKLVYLPTQRFPALYPKVKAILEAATGKWSTKEQAFVFDRDPKPILAEVCKNGQTVRVQKNLQAFYTPQSLIVQMVDAANLKPNDYVLEPSAGDGRICDYLFDNGWNSFAVENDPHAFEKLSETAAKRLQRDFLTVKPSDIGEFEAVIMNPPFAKDAWANHLLHAWTFLKDGGSLVCLAPKLDNMKSKPRQQVQALIDSHKGKVTKIPAGTFKESGTNIETAMIVLRKK